MEAMFQKAISFNQDISSWNVDQVTKYDEVFDGATALEEKHKPPKFR